MKSKLNLKEHISWKKSLIFKIITLTLKKKTNSNKTLTKINFKIMMKFNQIFINLKIKKNFSKAKETIKIQLKSLKT